MLTPFRISSFCVALTAVLSSTLLVADSNGSAENGDIQTISASAGSESPSNDSAELLPKDDFLVVADLERDDSSTDPAGQGNGPTDDAVTGQDSMTGENQSAAASEPSSEVTDQDPGTTDGDSSTASGNSSSSNSSTNNSSTNDSSSSNSSPTTQSSASQSKPASKESEQSPSTTTAPAAESKATPSPAQSSQFESMRNNNGKFSNYFNTPSNQLNAGSLMEPVSPVDHGGNGTGQFRIACEYSHFNYDDPIVFPGQPGKSHFHMYFGNTRVDSATTKDSLVNTGGGSCNGFELNRSAYWTPALMDGKGNAIVPDQIIIYYKTKKPNEVQPMPQGLQIVGGNANGQDFSPKETLFWSCGSSGHSYNHTNRIPSCGGDAVNATIAFPQCWDGKNLTSSDFSSHMKEISESSSCPASHPVRLPQLTYLLYFPPGDSSSWYLSSDRHGSFNTGPGATLHADWMGAWHEETMNLWLDTCVRRGRNCSYGQTGTPQKLAALNPLQTYAGDNVIPVPN